MEVIYYIIAFLAGAGACSLWHLVFDLIDKHNRKSMIKFIVEHMKEQETLQWEKEKSEE